MSYSDLSLRIFLQLAVILATCYIMGRIGRKIGQSQVVCEMVTGVLLGPSLLGLLAPGVQQWLFPKVATIPVGHTSVTITHPSMSILYTVSQLGLAIYMFLVGLEFETKLLRGRGKSASLLAGSGIIVPFLLGMVITPLLFQHTSLFGPGITVWMAALFVGATLSITAFPMLARMLQEYHLSTTKLGTLTLIAASIDDVSCWCLLAIILATYKSSALIALLAVGGGIIYVVGMLTLGRRFLSIYTVRAEQTQTISRQALIVVLLILMLSSWFTLAIGIYQISVPSLWEWRCREGGSAKRFASSLNR